MGFGRKMAHRVNGAVIKNFCHGFFITDVFTKKSVPTAEILFHTFKIFGIAGIGKLIHIYYAPAEISFIKQVAYEVGTDKSAPACDQKIFKH
jgi:hypothetical protein